MDTPRRIARMYFHEIFGGLGHRTFPKLTVVGNEAKCDKTIRAGRSACRPPVSITSLPSTARLPPGMRNV